MGAYSDKPYYENQFIDFVILKFNKNLLLKLNENEDFKEIGKFAKIIEYISEKPTKTENEKFKDLLKGIFLAHGFDILLSKIYFSYIDEEIKKNDTISQVDKISNHNYNEQLEMISKILQNRSFFGIDLLSSFFRIILSFLNENKLKVHLENNNFSTESENNKITRKEFLKELLISATDPLYIDYTDKNNCDLSAQIYFYEEKIQNENNYFKKFKESGKSSDKLIKFFYGNNYKDENYYIKIPIKLILSLPLKKIEVKKNKYESVVSSDILIPESLNLRENSTIDILTAGGAEHNSAIASNLGLVYIITDIYERIKKEPFNRKNSIFKNAIKLMRPNRGEKPIDNRGHTALIRFIDSVQDILLNELKIDPFLAFSYSKELKQQVIYLCSHNVEDGGIIEKIFPNQVTTYSNSLKE